MVNDRFGHMNGDLALRTIGEAMQAVAGKEELVPVSAAMNIMSLELVIQKIWQSSLIKDFRVSCRL